LVFFPIQPVPLHLLVNNCSPVPHFLLQGMLISQLDHS
jgi:hypothetical protein